MRNGRASSLAGAVALFSLGVLVGHAGPRLASGFPAAAAPAAAAVPTARPTWVLPVEKAREQAQRERKPLMLVSLNGNLDGYC